MEICIFEIVGWKFGFVGWRLNLSDGELTLSAGDLNVGALNLFGIKCSNVGKNPAQIKIKKNAFPRLITNNSN